MVFLISLFESLDTIFLTLFTLNFFSIYDIIFIHGADLVSTGIFEHRWQVECPRHGHKKINANKIKNAVANLFGGRQAVAFA